MEANSAYCLSRETEHMFKNVITGIKNKYDTIKRKTRTDNTAHRNNYNKLDGHKFFKYVLYLKGYSSIDPKYSCNFENSETITIPIS